MARTCPSEEERKVGISCVLHIYQEMVVLTVKVSKESEHLLCAMHCTGHCCCKAEFQTTAPSPEAHTVGTADS